MCPRHILPAALEDSRGRLMPAQLMAACVCQPEGVLWSRAQVVSTYWPGWKDWGVVECLRKSLSQRGMGASEQRAWFPLTPVRKLRYVLRWGSGIESQGPTEVTRSLTSPPTVFFSTCTHVLSQGLLRGDPDKDRRPCTRVQSSSLSGFLITPRCLQDTPIAPAPDSAFEFELAPPPSFAFNSWHGDSLLRYHLPWPQGLIQVAPS